MHPLRLCFLIDSIKSQKKLETLLSAIKGGITSVQFRNKYYDSESLYLEALELKKILKPYKIPLIINDNVQVAKEVNAEGIHLGQSDTDVATARKILGENKIIGLSIESFEELDIANNIQELSYVAASAVFESISKTNLKTIWGIEGLKKIVKISAHPVVAIGGINEHNIKDVMTTKVAGVAVISAIENSPNPEITSRTIINEIEYAYRNNL